MESVISRDGASTFEFRGTGSELFGKLIVGALLTGITFGIYASWFLVDLYKYLYSKTMIRGTAAGDLQLEYTGTGGELFKRLFVGQILVGLTLGIYLPWFIVNIAKFMQNNSKAIAPDGSSYQLDLSITGGELFKAGLINGLLTGITFGIYAPWAFCKIQALFAEKTALLKNGQAYGRFAFTAQGGELFATFLVGAILTSITFGIYAAWFNVKMMQFSVRHTELSVNGRVYSGDFVGTGGDLFVINLVGGILTGLTLGIYGFWYLEKLLKFNLGNTIYGTRALETSVRMPLIPANA
ncbi:MAG: DUF898 family protein [Myxococcota bacterium]